MIDAAREYILPRTVIETSGGDPSTGEFKAAVQAGQNNYQTLSQNPYLGGVPPGKLSATPVALSLEDAVAFGLRQNLGGALATDAVIDARGQRWQALSELLTNVVTDTVTKPRSWSA